jgi:hypothetical protein
MNIEESGCFCQEMAADDLNSGGFQALVQCLQNKEAGLRAKIELYYVVVQGFLADQKVWIGIYISPKVVSKPQIRFKGPACQRGCASDSKN